MKHLITVLGYFKTFIFIVIIFTHYIIKTMSKIKTFAFHFIFFHRQHSLTVGLPSEISHIFSFFSSRQ